ncbi:MAG: DUF4834 family protein [Ekhidna sp.]
MLKFFLILILIVYALFRLGGFILRIFFGSLGKQQYSQQQASSSRRAPGSNLNIDNVQKPSSKKEKNFSGGEYVDYEEVK